MHRNTGEKAKKIQCRASSEDGAPKLQISVPRRGRTCPDCFGGENSLSLGANSVSSAKNSVSSLLHANARLRGAHEVTEFSPRSSVRAKNSLSSVFETVLSETVFGPSPILGQQTWKDVVLQWWYCFFIKFAAEFSASALVLRSRCPPRPPKSPEELG